MTTDASFTRINTGSCVIWGLRCPPDTMAGKIVRVRKKNGEVKELRTSRLVDTKPDGWKIFEIDQASEPKPVKYKKYRRSGGCGYPGCNGINYCDECSD